MHWKVSARACAASAAVLVMTAAGPGRGQTLHDAQLEKATAEILAAHKKADVPAAMQKVLDQQAALDRAELEKIRAVDAANQERALSELLSADPDFRGTARLQKLVTSRLDWIAGQATISPQVWVDRREKLVLVNTAADPQERVLKTLVRTYEQEGGHDFVDCASFAEAHADGSPAPFAGRIINQCIIIASANAPDAAFSSAVTALEKGGGEFQEITRQRDDAKTLAGKEETARKTAATDLKAAKAALDEAKKAPDAKAQVVEEMKKLDALLTEIDQRAGLVGNGALAPGAALAAIEFRKTNLRDVLAANGSDEDTPAAKMNRDIVGAIAGVRKYRAAGAAPSQAALTIALAHQTGLEAVAGAKLYSLKLQARLLSEQREALLREVEYLALARAALAAIPGSAQCNRRPLADVALAELVRNPRCPLDVRQSAARAISAYNMSWASGRTPARVRDAQVSQEIYWRKLRVTDQVVRARYQVQQTALEELAAAGASGVKPAEIAAFLQAIGIQAIAIGVN